MKNRRKTVYYVCFYAESENSKKIVSYPSVWSKIDYVASVIKEYGYDVELVSEATSVKGLFRGYKKQIDDQERVKYFTSRHYNNNLMNKLSTLTQWCKVLCYLLLHVKREDKLLVYHSIYNLKWLSVYHDLFGKKFSLEIEDVFSALNDEWKTFEKKEWNLFSKASTCICVNDLIAQKLNQKLSKIISYGSYLLPEYHKAPRDKTVRLVYAGVIEQQRNAAFLAVQAMRYLPGNYELNILGFGDDRDICALKECIKKVDRNIKYRGRMEGQEYYSFLQSCDIGLSTHVYDDGNMASADNTFPSKILVYLSNGLHVVAQRLACLEQSLISDTICYYDEPDPQKVAEAISNADLSTDTRQKISELATSFQRDIQRWLSGIE